MLHAVYHAKTGQEFYVCKDGDPEKWMWDWQEMLGNLRGDSLKQILPEGTAVAGCCYKEHGDGVQRTGCPSGHFVVTRTDGVEWWLKPNYNKTEVGAHTGSQLNLDQREHDGAQKTFKRLRNDISGPTKLRFAPKAPDWRKTNWRCLLHPKGGKGGRGTIVLIVERRVATTP